MIPFFPRQIANRAIIVYLAALIVTNIYYLNYAMSVGYIALGITWVLGFFLLTSSMSRSWSGIKVKTFVEYLFLLAIFLRLIWVVFSYYYYQKETGSPFEFGAADSLGYHGEAEWLSGETWHFIIDYYFGPGAIGISDSGYPLYLTALYKLFGPKVIIPRIIKAFLSAFTCVLVYKVSSRTFGEQTGRIAGLIAALMPNLIIYCGYHLKETEMIFLEVAFLERLDYLVRNRKYGLFTILVPTLLAGSLFLFRTVLGATAVFTFATTVLFSSAPMMKRNARRAALIGWGILCLITVSGGTIINEIEGYWAEREVHASNKRLERTLRGNQWAQYATGTVMAPMAFVLPFATMVDIDQQFSQQEKSGGNYVRNFMGIFALLGIYEAFRRKKWRDFAMIGSFVIAYLGVVSLSGFNNSERFLLPGLPGLIMIWSYGVSSLRDKTYSLLTPWCFVVFLMEFAWAYFKLGSRGLF